MTGHELAANRRAVRRADEHSLQLRRARRFDRAQRTHRVQYPRRLGTEILGAWLGPRESGPIDKNDVNADAGESSRRRRAGRAASDYEHIARLLHAKSPVKRNAAAAPNMVASRFTASFSTNERPPMRWVGAPQEWICISVAFPQASHHN